MKRPIPASLAIALAATLSLAGPTRACDEPMPAARPETAPIIEVAILLDTSGSMDGLINQARARLWAIVNQMARTKRDGKTPDLRVALYEYGNNKVTAENGFVRQIMPLSDDLDLISKELFALTTDGGSEHCGQAIQFAASQLAWTPGDHFRAIFIAGNEPFTQGPVDYQAACKLAIEQSIIINPIHCGPEGAGRNGKWDHGAILADGQFLNIDHNAATVVIAAPQDEHLAVLGRRLNDTYVGYGRMGRERKDLQGRMDSAARRAAPSAEAERAVSKAGKLYRNSAWDLVDAEKEGKVELEKLKDEELPEEMRKMSLEDRRAHLDKKAQERQEIQQKIQELSEERSAFIAKELDKQAEQGEETFDTAVRKVLEQQLSEKGFSSEK